MISVQINDEWVPKDEEQLAELLLDGRLEASSPARDPVRSAAVAPLLELLQPRHQEELARQLLRRLARMYISGEESVDLASLLERVEQWLEWKWTDELIKGRLEWIEAWLKELAGFSQMAIASYNAYLRGTSLEPLLCLLAYNNRGVLRICLSQADGVKDLARAAVPADGGGNGLSPSRKLPAACFNLMNLINYVLKQNPLCDQVDEMLVDYMAGLPREIREQCIGPDDPELQIADEAGQAASESDREEDVLSMILKPARSRSTILKDPTLARLNCFMAYLLDGALRIAPVAEGGSFEDVVASQLQLWTPRPAGELAETQMLASPQSEPDGAGESLGWCAEAASLLFACDIPATLRPTEESSSLKKQWVGKALKLIESYVANGDCEQAERSARSLCEALKTSESDPMIRSMREEAAQCLAEVQQKAHARRQSDLYKTCVTLVDEVRVFRTLTDLCQAEYEAQALLRRIRKAAGPSTTGEANLLLKDLPEQIAKHVEWLRHADIEQRIDKPRQILQSTCPRDWRQSVPRETQDALDLCRIHDPENLVDDWDAWKACLDRHQARHDFRQVLSDISGGNVNAASMESTLDTAIRNEPELALACAPIYSFLALRGMGHVPNQLAQARPGILDMIKRLLETEPLGTESLWSSAVRTALIREACSLLQRLIRAYHNVGAELEDLWRALEKSYAPAFGEAPPRVLREIQTEIDVCLKACPVHNAGKNGRVDPRNRLQILRETCDIAVEIALGEEALSEIRMEEARRHFEDGIVALTVSGPESGEYVQLLKRGAGGMYLALFGGTDPKRLQRRVLNELDRRLEQTRQEESGPALDVKSLLADIRKQMGLIPEGQEPRREEQL